MPASTQTRVSSSSSSLRNRRHRQYRTVSDHSQVDETLFGEPNHVKWKQQKSLASKSTCNSNNNSNNNNRPGRKTQENSAKEKETVMIIMRDLIRTLAIPEKDPSQRTVVLDPNEFTRIKDNARILSEEERHAMEELQREHKANRLRERVEREQYMKKKDLQRETDHILTDIEIEAKTNAQSLLAKANEMKQEQADEIKHLNELIHEAKCHAILDAQVEEKKIIKNEMSVEELRLDMMMEVDRQNAIRIQDEIEKNRKMVRAIGAEQLKQQIMETEQRKMIELEEKEADNEAMRRQVAQLIAEDEAQLLKKKQDQVALRNQLKKTNDELRDIKIRQEKQEKLEELHVLEFQRKKAEREAAYEAEQEKQRVEKQREIARLLVMQERARDDQADRDALRAKRATEEAEREWRKKEALEAKKKCEMEAMLIESRKQQMQQKEHFLAIQAQKDRADFEKILRAHKEVVEKEKRDAEAIKSRAMQHLKEIRAQMAAKEKEKISERQAFFEEGRKYQEEEILHRQKLESVKEKKMQELKNAGIPEKYLLRVQREAIKSRKV